MSSAAAAKGSNQYQFLQESSSPVSAPVPINAEFLHHKIKHMIYNVKEDRTFDQILISDIDPEVMSSFLFYSEDFPPSAVPAAD